MKTIILAAGKGSRLGDPDLPKPLTILDNGKSILDWQLEQLKPFVEKQSLSVIVGFHEAKIMQRFPFLHFVHNSNYANENTAKSLLRALKYVYDEDILWLNGDVVFHPSVPKHLLSMGKSCMLTNQGEVGEEEVKYRTDSIGKILEVSKSVAEPEGEALGINFLQKEFLENFKNCLESCNPSDYFEKGIEKLIQMGIPIYSCVINRRYCTEIDFPEDLVKANALIQLWSQDENTHEQSSNLPAF